MLPSQRLSDWSREHCTNPGGVRQEVQWKKFISGKNAEKHQGNNNNSTMRGNTTDDSTRTEPKYQLN